MLQNPLIELLLKLQHLSFTQLYARTRRKATLLFTNNATVVAYQQR